MGNEEEAVGEGFASPVDSERTTLLRGERVRTVGRMPRLIGFLSYASHATSE